MPEKDYIPLTGEMAETLDPEEYGGAWMRITGKVVEGEVCKADFDQDETVDGADLWLLSQTFGHAVGDPLYNPDMDFDHNGTVDTFDLTTFTDEFGRDNCPSVMGNSNTQNKAADSDWVICKSCLLVHQYQFISRPIKYAPGLEDILIEAGTPQPHKWAVLFSGGINSFNAHKRYWMDLKFMYSMLINKYKYDPNNILVLYKNGTKEDKNMPVHYAATQTNLNTALNAVKKVSTDQDSVFIFTTNHGGGFNKDDLYYPIGSGIYCGREDVGGDEGTEPLHEQSYWSCMSGAKQGKSCKNNYNCSGCSETPPVQCCGNYGLDLNGDGDVNDQVSWDEELCSWGGSIYDDSLTTMLLGLKYHRLIIVMEQCFSGGFLRDLAGNNRIIISASTQYESSWSMGPSYTYNEFSYHFTSALNGKQPDGTTVDADADNDGEVSMVEAFNYAVSNDTANETPMYEDNNDGVSHSGPIPKGGDGSLGSNTSL